MTTIDNICLLICDIEALSRLKRQAEACMTNLKLITNGVDENTFLESIESEKKKIHREINCMKASVWDALHANNEAILIDTNSSAVIGTLSSQQETITDIKDKTMIVDRLDQKVNNIEALCATVRDLIIEISDFLRRDDFDRGGEMYAIIPNVCNLPKNIPVMSASGKPCIHLQITLKKIEDLLQDIVVEKKVELIEEKSKHYDELFVR